MDLNRAMLSRKVTVPSGPKCDVNVKKSKSQEIKTEHQEVLESRRFLLRDKQLQAVGSRPVVHLAQHEASVAPDQGIASGKPVFDNLGLAGA